VTSASTAAGPSASTVLPAIEPGRLKTLCVMATPPDAIRLAPIAQQLSNDSRFDARVCVAAQGDQTPDQVLGLFGINADVHLDVAFGDDPSENASRALSGMKRVLHDFRPDVVLVPGNTSTTLAATLAAFYQQIPVVCIEPGGAQARPSANRLDEANRKITRALASLHFTPSESTGDRLLADGVPADRIVVAGNTVMGTLRAAVERIRNDTLLSQHLGECFGFLRPGNSLLLMADRESMQFGSDAVAIASPAPVTSMPRRRASDSPVNHAFAPICQALYTVAIQRPDVDIVYPIDERSLAAAGMHELIHDCPNIHLIPPTDYMSFAYLLNHADAILADSADMAFEVASFGKPVLLVQEQAGIGPALDAGNVSRVGLQEHVICAGILELLEEGWDAARFGSLRGGHRDATERIVDALANRRHLRPTASAGEAVVPAPPFRPVVEDLQEAS
jgi:UDP-N-acetylglucosamine 2-epimerase (non-hydrolysing)